MKQLDEIELAWYEHRVKLNKEQESQLKRYIQRLSQIQKQVEEIINYKSQKQSDDQTIQYFIQNFVPTTTFGYQQLEQANEEQLKQQQQIQQQFEEYIRLTSYANKTILDDNYMKILQFFRIQFYIKVINKNLKQKQQDTAINENVQVQEMQNKINEVFE